MHQPYEWGIQSVLACGFFWSNFGVNLNLNNSFVNTYAGEGNGEYLERGIYIGETVSQRPSTLVRSTRISYTRQALFSLRRSKSTVVRPSSYSGEQQGYHTFSTTPSQPQSHRILNDLAAAKLLRYRGSRGGARRMRNIPTRIICIRPPVERKHPLDALLSTVT